VQTCPDLLLQVCVDCNYGAEKDGKSHCGREAVYSYLTRCIQLKAMEYYQENAAVEEESLGMVGNQ
jgi:hypothetical protein